MEVNKMTRIAIPSMNDSGLESDICAHFGSCEYFTIVIFQRRRSEEVGAIKQCFPGWRAQLRSTGDTLKNNNVDAVLVSGIGGRPLMSLTSKGIRVFGGAFGLVSDALNDYIRRPRGAIDQGTCNCSHH